MLEVTTLLLPEPTQGTLAHHHLHVWPQGSWPSWPHGFPSLLIQGLPGTIVSLIDTSRNSTSYRISDTSAYSYDRRRTDENRIFQSYQRNPPHIRIQLPTNSNGEREGDQVPQEGIDHPDRGPWPSPTPPPSPTAQRTAPPPPSASAAAASPGGLLRRMRPAGGPSRRECESE